MFTHNLFVCNAEDINTQDIEKEIIINNDVNEIQEVQEVQDMFEDQSEEDIEEDAFDLYDEEDIIEGQNIEEQNVDDTDIDELENDIEDEIENEQENQENELDNQAIQDDLIDSLEENENVNIGEENIASLSEILEEDVASPSDIEEDIASPSDIEEDIASPSDIEEDIASPSDIEDIIFTSDGNAQFKVDDTTYDSLVAAIDAVNDEGTIYCIEGGLYMNDYFLSTDMKVNLGRTNKKYTIDFQNKNIDFSPMGEYVFVINALNSEVTIKNLTQYTVSTSCDFFYISNFGGNLNISNSSIMSNNVNCYINASVYAVCQISLSHTSQTESANNGHIINVNNSPLIMINIENCDFEYMNDDVLYVADCNQLIFDFTGGTSKLIDASLEKYVLNFNRCNIIEGTYSYATANRFVGIGKISTGDWISAIDEISLDIDFIYIDYDYENHIQGWQGVLNMICEWNGWGKIISGSIDFRKCKIIADNIAYLFTSGSPEINLYNNEISLAGNVFNAAGEVPVDGHIKNGKFKGIGYAIPSDIIEEYIDDGHQLVELTDDEYQYEVTDPNPEPDPDPPGPGPGPEPDPPGPEPELDPDPPSPPSPSHGGSSGGGSGSGSGAHIDSNGAIIDGNYYIDSVSNIDALINMETGKFYIDVMGYIIDKNGKTVGSIYMGDILSDDKTYFINKDGITIYANGEIKYPEKNVKENNDVIDIGTWEYQPLINKWRYFNLDENNSKVYYEKRWINTKDKKGNNTWYAIDSNGYMVTGWLKAGGEYYYMSPNLETLGEITKGNITIAGEKYIFDRETGKLLGDKKPIDFKVLDAENHKSGVDGDWSLDKSANKKKFIEKNKSLTTEELIEEKPVTGWYMIDGYYYFFDDEGYALAGLIESDGKYYYLEPDGRMLEGGERVIDGVTYVFDKATGACRSSRVDIENLNNIV